MRTTYRNELYKVIEKTKMDPSMFEIYEGDDNGFDTTIIRLIDSNHQFTIIESPQSYNRFSYKYTLNQPAMPETKYRRKWLPLHLLYRGNRVKHKFSTVKGGLKKWIKRELKDYFRDVEAQDLWQKALNEPIIDFHDHDYNYSDRDEYFNEEEKDQIQLAIQQAREEIEVEIPMDEDRLRALDEKMEYLIDSVERLNKFDWRSVLMASTIDIASNIALDGVGAKTIMDIFRTAFSALPRLLGRG